MIKNSSRSTKSNSLVAIVAMLFSFHAHNVHSQLNSSIDPIERPMTFFEYCDGMYARTCHIYGVGQITADETAAKFASFLGDDAGEFRQIRLCSYGGSLAEGIKLGRLLRKNGFTTDVSFCFTESRVDDDGSTVEPVSRYELRDAVCESACALAFLGGVFRSAYEGALSFHQFALPEEIDRPLKSQRSLSGVLIDAQIMSADVISYLNDMDVDAILFVESSKAYLGKNADKNFYIPTPSEMEALRIVTNQPEFGAFRVEYEEPNYTIRSVRTFDPHYLSGNFVSMVSAFCVGYKVAFQINEIDDKFQIFIDEEKYLSYQEFDDSESAWQIEIGGRTIVSSIMYSALLDDSTDYEERPRSYQILINPEELEFISPGDFIEFVDLDATSRVAFHFLRDLTASEAIALRGLAATCLAGPAPRMVKLLYQPEGAEQRDIAVTVRCQRASRKIYFQTRNLPLFFDYSLDSSSTSWKVFIDDDYSGHTQLLFDEEDLVFEVDIVKAPIEYSLKQLTLAIYNLNEIQVIFERDLSKEEKDSIHLMLAECYY